MRLLNRVAISMALKSAHLVDEKRNVPASINKPRGATRQDAVARLARSRERALDVLLVSRRNATRIEAKRRRRASRAASYKRARVCERHMNVDERALALVASEWVTRHNRRPSARLLDSARRL